MADKNNSNSVTGDDALQLQEVALAFASERSTQHGLSRGMAVACFRDARLFLDVAKDALSGKLDANEWVTALDAAFAPNLKRTHPINLMSHALGSLKDVKRVHEALNANVAAESYDEYEWGKQEVALARHMFPAVLERARSMNLLPSSN
ncbi:hypothetical protein [Schlesneria sp. T3-172]|uniref:hypothetical protein n=1 Tax=Schlesneria sphaerica TaxID=3373610 RepID=UPI0037CC184D